MLLRQLFDPETWTYTYLIANKNTHEALLIDPVVEHVDSYIALLKDLDLTLRYTLDTHVHADHITGSGTLREKVGCQSVMHETTRAKCVDIRLNDGGEIALADLTVKAIHTPGHTPCHLSFLIEDRVFTGDALFIKGCGRTDFQGGNPRQLWNSVVNKLFQLPPDTLVYPGHDYRSHHVSTILQEQELNPRFLKQTEESFVELMNSLDLPDPKKIMEAVPANEACGLI